METVTNSQQTTISDLPLDVMNHLCGYLPLKSVLHLRCVQRPWQHAWNEERLLTFSALYIRSLVPKDTVFRLTGGITNVTYPVLAEGLKILHEKLKNRRNPLAFNCCNLGLKELPAEIGQFANVRCLELGYNGITENGIAQLCHWFRNIEKLDLNDNELTGLPAEIGNLTCLKYLNISGNDITFQTLQNIFKSQNLRQLKCLVLGQIKLSPDELEKIKQLLPATKILI